MAKVKITLTDPEDPDFQQDVHGCMCFSRKAVMGGGRAEDHKPDPANGKGASAEKAHFPPLSSDQIIRGKWSRLGGPDYVNVNKQRPESGITSSSLESRGHN